jgi:plastocyanin
MFRAGSLLGLGVLAVALIGCSSGAPSASKPSQPASAPAQQQRSASSRPTATPEPAGQLIQIGQVTFADYGARDATKQTSRGLDAGDYYFKGTFISGRPGQALTLEIKNVGTVVHNFSIPAQRISQDIQPKSERVNVDVTFPESGAVQFLCNYHSAQGMNGLLLAGDATPQALASPQPGASPRPASSPSPSPQPRG